MFTWIIYYGDGSTFSNEDGNPEDAPPFGVQAIACDDGLWLGGDFTGLVDYLSRPGKKVVRFGRHVANWRFLPAVKAARESPYVSPDRTIMEHYDFYWWEGDLKP